MLSYWKTTAHRAERTLVTSKVARMMATVALLLSVSALGVGWATHGSPDTGTARAAAALALKPKAAPALQLGQADFHVDAGGYGMSVSITQMSNDCGVVATGSYCLRYSVETEDELPLQVGYGLIPASDVAEHGATISLSVDTRTVQGMRQAVGTGGVIALVWTSTSVSPASTIRQETTQLHMASVHGTILGHGIPATGTTAAILYFARG